MNPAQEAEKQKPLKRRLPRVLRVLFWCVGVVFVAVIIIQLLYPAERGLPFASVVGKSVAFANQNDITKAIIDKFDSSKVKLSVSADRSVEYSLKSIGAEPNIKQMIAKLGAYPFWQRFIPGSILWQTPKVFVADVSYSKEQLIKAAELASKELSLSSKNARLAIEKGQLIANDEIDGIEVKSEDVSKSINETQMSLNGTTVINVPHKHILATLRLKDLEKVRSQAEQILAHTLVINAANQQFSPSKDELASWVLLSPNDKGEITLLLDKQKIDAYISEVNNEFSRPAGQINVTIVDGFETGRTSAEVGQYIDSALLSEQITDTFLKGDPRDILLEAKVVTVQPSIIYNSQYTSTQAGLQAYANDIAYSRNMYISIQQVTGDKWIVNARSAESLPSASTYKLFVALILFDRIDSGEIHWDDSMLDTTVAGCFERMTVVSTNPCAEKWIEMFGRDYINNYIYAKGFSTGTTFTAWDAVHTTAADLTKYMIGLYDGTLLGGANRDRLLDSLGRHPYRYGIPTGSAGIVHDKVGFLWDYVHDAGIVQHPRGTYVMTVMTKGQSYAAIATVTREVERIMYP